MGIIKKTVWMVLGSLALLLVLGFADPTNVRLMPSITEHFTNLLRVAGFHVEQKDAPDKEEIHRAIAGFSHQLAQAYLDMNPAALTAVPMDERLRRNYIEEIEFLQKDGRVLALTVQDIQIKQVSELPNLMWSVDTLESVEVRYLKTTDRTEMRAYPKARYAMNYTLEKSGAHWKIAATETMNVGSADE